MRKFLISIFYIFLICHAEGFGQVEISDTREFILTTIDGDGKESEEKLRLKLIGKYKGKEKQFTLQEYGAEEKDAKSLNSPLNHSELSEILNTLINSSKDKKAILSRYSLEIVFFWLYSLKQDDTGPTAGMLQLGQWTRIMRATEINTRARTLDLQERATRFTEVRNSYLSYRNSLEEKLKEIDSIDKNSEQNFFIKKMIDEKIDPSADSNFQKAYHRFFCKHRDHFEGKDSIINLRINLSGFLDKMRRMNEILISNLQANSANFPPHSNLLYQSLPLAGAYASRRPSSMNPGIIMAIGAFAITYGVDKTVKELDLKVRNILGQGSTYKFDLNESFSHQFINSKAQDFYFQYFNYLDAATKYDQERSLISTSYQPIEKLSIQFEKGYLERIQVWVKNDRGALEIFENIYAIGFSSIKNYKDFESVRLFIRRAPSAGNNDHIYLSDVITNYDNLLDLYTRDYSPGDTALNDLQPSQGIITLRKERAVRLFDSKIFSDLQGINADAPNGLIQVEVSRRFNLKTSRQQVGGRTNFNLFSYLFVYGAISKIEEKFKELPLRNKMISTNGVITSPSVVSNLDLRRYENASLGFDYNPLFYDYPDLKFTAFYDVGLRYGHVKLVDSFIQVLNNEISRPSVPQSFSGHTVTFQPIKLRVEIFSERRVGFNVSYAFNHTYAFTNNRFKQIMSYEKSAWDNRITERAARNSHMAEVLIRVETSREGDGQFFLRSRFFWQKGDANTFFAQTQLGYAYNIIFRK